MPLLPASDPVDAHLPLAGPAPLAMTATQTVLFVVCNSRQGP